MLSTHCHNNILNATDVLSMCSCFDLMLVCYGGLQCVLARACSVQGHCNNLISHMLCGMLQQSHSLPVQHFSPKLRVVKTVWSHLLHMKLLFQLSKDCGFQQWVDLTGIWGYQLYRFESKLQLELPGLVKQQSYFFLRPLLAFFEPFVEIAGLAVRRSSRKLCILFVKTFEFGKNSALRLTQTPLADGP